MGNIILHDKEFRPFIEATKIDQVITRMAEQMNRELADTQPLFLSILNGSLIGLKEDIQNRTVVILEDIIDSGRSMKHLLEYLHAKNPKQVIVATLFHKPKAAVCQVPIAYKGIELENDFVVGRGLDYDGLGRNYPDLYILNA